MTEQQLIHKIEIYTGLKVEPVEAAFSRVRRVSVVSPCGRALLKLSLETFQGDWYVTGVEAQIEPADLEETKAAPCPSCGVELQQ